MFIDRVVVKVEAGDGGSGISSFRREKFVPMGGPDGGDGGTRRRRDRARRHATSPRCSTTPTATCGRRSAASTACGLEQDRALGRRHRAPVPPGTVVRDASTGEFIGEVLEDGDELRRRARAAAGGKGNAFFATSTHQAPREWQPGEEGERATLELELKLIADVGLVGQPNAGKSTLLSVISAARPKIADYPFTTLSPNLGVVQLSDHRTFVVADIPGIIEGAHEGQGARPPVPAAHRAHAPARVPDPDRRDGLAGGVRPAAPRDRGVLGGAGAEAALRRVHQDGPARRGSSRRRIEAPGAFGLLRDQRARPRRGLDALLAAWWQQLLAAEEAEIEPPAAPESKRR